MSKGYNQYKKTAVQSASREKLLLMLYEGAIKFTKQAKMAMEEKKIAEKGMLIGRAFDIVMELNNTLDHKIGGDLAVQLEQLYMYITEQYTQANITNNPEHLDNALGVLNTLHEGWVEAIQQMKQEAAGGSR